MLPRSILVIDRASAIIIVLAIDRALKYDDPDEFQRRPMMTALDRLSKSENGVVHNPHFLATMKVITWNVNGIRAIERKSELQNLVADQQPDVLMLQETKASVDQLSEFLRENAEYTQFYSSAEKKGYSGTAIWLKKDCMDNLDKVEFKTAVPNAPNADEGRICHLSFERDGQHWDMFSIYFPNGGKSDQAWEDKLVFYDRVHDHMNDLRAQGHRVLVGGDMNVAHTEIDIARPKANNGKIGFHPRERAWMDRLIDDNWLDVWRHLNPGVTDVYSWWHVFTKGRERNVGWRIDYFLLDSNSLDQVRDVCYLHDQMGSDHCPMLIAID